MLLQQNIMKTQVTEEFYRDLNQLLNQQKNNEITIMMGDMNAQAGAGGEGDVIGDFGLRQK